MLNAYADARAVTKMMVIVRSSVTCFMVARQWSWLEVMVAEGRKAARENISKSIFFLEM